MSGLPPGAEETSKRIGRFGYASSCASEGENKPSAIANAAGMTAVLACMFSPCYAPGWTNYLRRLPGCCANILDLKRVSPASVGRAKAQRRAHASAVIQKPGGLRFRLAHPTKLQFSQFYLLPKHATVCCRQGFVECRENACLADSRRDAVPVHVGSQIGADAGEN